MDVNSVWIFKGSDFSEFKNPLLRYGNSHWPDGKTLGHNIATFLINCFFVPHGDSWQIDRSPSGKPIVKGIDSCHFNLSHSGEWFAVALSKHGPIGVDIEQQRPVNYEDIAKRFFTDSETKEVLSASNPMEIFFRVWTRKESSIKAAGLGLPSQLRKIETDPLATTQRLAIDGSDWFTQDFPLHSNCFGSVTAKTKGFQFYFKDNLASLLKTKQGDLL